MNDGDADRAIIIGVDASAAAAAVGSSASKSFGRLVSAISMAARTDSLRVSNAGTASAHSTRPRSLSKCAMSPGSALPAIRCDCSAF